MRSSIALTLLAAAVQLQAQVQMSPPPVMKAKASAQRAVDAANARTVASSTLPAETQKPGAPVGAAPAKDVERSTPAARTDSAAGSTSVKSAGPAFERETYIYERGGRRDPFLSLMTTGELRPVISDLTLVAVAFDPAGGRNSVAVVHDISTKEKQQYRIKVGHSLGRMRVAAITQKTVVFTIEEFGFSRQETLALGATNQERKQ